MLLIKHDCICVGGPTHIKLNICKLLFSMLESFQMSEHLKGLCGITGK